MTLRAAISAHRSDDRSAVGGESECAGIEHCCWVLSTQRPPLAVCLKHASITWQSMCATERYPTRPICCRRHAKVESDFNPRVAPSEMSTTYKVVSSLLSGRDESIILPTDTAWR